MKRLLFLFLCFLFYTSTFAQTYEWTWMGGDNTINQYGVYGTKGVPSSSNKPGARYGAVTWTDASGNLWLFGGIGSDNVGYLNDLWKYTPSTNQWTWVHGDNTTNQPGIYGTKGVASSTNKPGGRWRAMSWTDASGNFWLFGGNGYPSTTRGGLNDLWKFNPTTNQWTWISGDNLTNQFGNYGTKGVSAATNKPGHRVSGATWTDASGNLWLFGGSGYAVSNSGYLNDLWKFNPTTNQWTWINGDNIVNQYTVYGTKGITSVNNKVGARFSPASWTDASGNFWLFGGQGYAATGSGTFNDLWKYSPSTNQWTWIHGDNTTNQPGIYGTKGTAGASNKPGAKSSATSLTDPSGNFWLFGGSGSDISTLANDLWKYTPSTNQWTWVGGDNVFAQPAIYGTKGTAGASNKPGARNAAVGWIGTNGSLWVFGGDGYAANTNYGELNDFWKAAPITHSIGNTSLSSSNLCANAAFTISFQANGTYNSGNAFTAQLSDASGNFTSPAIIGTVSGSSSGNYSLNATVPAIALGSGYKVRVVSNNPAVISSDNNTITINAVPIASLSGAACTGGILTLNSNIAPTQIVWQKNGTPVSTANATVTTTKVAGGDYYGSEPTNLSSPHSVFIDASGNMYVADGGNNRVQKFAPGSTSGITVAGGNGEGSAANQLSLPQGIFVDASGNLYVTDNGNHRVQKWAPGATSGITVAGGNGEGSAANQLYGPADVFVDGSGNIFIADRLNYRVQKWTPGAASGVTVAGTGGWGTGADQLRAVSGVFMDASGNLYVSDEGNNRVQKFAPGSTTGVTIAGGNGIGSAANQLYGPADVFVDGSGNVFVPDMYNNRVQKFASGSTTGTTVAGGNDWGSNANQLAYPNGVAVDASGSVYVADVSNHRIQKVSSTISLTYTTTDAGSYTAVVTGPGGCTATTNAITVTTATSPEVNITASATNIKPGTSVTFTATPSNAGTSPSYQWKKNGVNAGTNSSTYIDNSLNNGDVISCALTRTEGCTASVTSNSITIAVTTNSINVHSLASYFICQGAPFNINFSANGSFDQSNVFTAELSDASGSFDAPAYIGEVNGHTSGTYTIVANFDNFTAPGTGYKIRVISNDLATIGVDTTSITIKESPQTVLITDGAPEIALCSGQPVAMSVGQADTYQWYKNEVAIEGATSNAYSATTPGIYKVIQANNNGCSYTHTINIPTPAALTTYYRDGDGDGYGNLNDTKQACAAPTGYVSNSTDCNDNDVTIHPGATETANGKDEDCDGQIDEDLEQTFYRDYDKDGYGDSKVIVKAVSAPTGYVAQGGDCSDRNAAINPGVTEVANGIDDNCNGIRDEGFEQITFYRDIDKDGYGSTSTLIAAVAPTGYVAQGGDCNDANATINPSANEVANGLDDDCDGQRDEGFETFTFYKDSDKDGYGGTSTIIANTAPAGYVAINGDCNDANPNIYPGASESANGLDDDCDGQRDEDFETFTFFKDNDKDGYGGASTIEAAIAPAGYVSVGGDCNDANATIYPGAPEQANGLDDDCDGLRDEDFELFTFYRDSDKDGYGGKSAIQANTAPAGYVAQGGDCNDAKATVYPNAPELCDGLDNDCDGIIDNGLSQQTFYRDGDKDGYGGSTKVNACVAPIGYVAIGGDCNDANAAIYPGAEELANGLDDNCDGTRDEGFDIYTFYKDNDKDGYGGASTIQAAAAPAGYVEQGGDCNDSKATIYPGAPELCDALDNDCDGTIDDGQALTTFYRDADKDGYGSTIKVMACTAPVGYVSITGDCVDNNAAIYPGATEIANGLDDNCNGTRDDGFPQQTFYLDYDKDGYGSATAISAAVAPVGYVSVGGDCNDRNATVYPGAPELCDGLDNNCDKVIDDGLDQQTFYKDYDKDGFGDVRYKLNACAAPVGYVAAAGDCNDRDASIYPGVIEVAANGKDDNCNGQIDEAVTLDVTSPTVARATAAPLVATLTVKAMPNPAPSYFTLQLSGGSDQPLTIRILDAVGRIKEVRHNVSANTNLQLGNHYQPGIYYAEVLQGSERVVVKLVKSKQ